MEFKKITLTYVGVKGIVPERWTQIGDGQFRRASSDNDPTMLFERAFAHVDCDVVKDVLAREIGLDAFPEPVGTLDTGTRSWELYSFDHHLPYLGTLKSDFALVQDGSWMYLVSLSTEPNEHNDLYDAVFIPVVKAFTPLNRQFGRLAGGVPDPSQGPTLAQQLGYGIDDILVVVHADDVGYHLDQTDGVLSAMEIGMCKTGSVMVPCPDFERVVSIWQKRPELDLGIHLTLNSEWGTQYGWSPILPESQVPSLYNPDGLMWGTEWELKEHVNVDEALMEIEAQILKVLEAGLTPTHVDEHMGCYWWNFDLTNGVMQLARKYNLCMLPVDISKMRTMGYVFPDSFWQFASNMIGEEKGSTIRKKVYDDWLQNLGPGVHQVMTHIANVTEDYASKVHGAHFRHGDYVYWTSPETKALAEALGITFIGYRELRQLQAANWAC